MNKIVIIGNGFDLAHGLKTSYKDLMGYIKESASLETKKTSDCGSIHYDSTIGNDYISFSIIPRRPKNEYKFTTCRKKRSIYFKALFDEYNRYDKWVDLESLYFKLLNENISNSSDVELINKEFDYLKKILESYLLNEVEGLLPARLNDFKECIFETKNDDRLLGIINFNYTMKLVRYHLDYFNRFSLKMYQQGFQNINVHGVLNSVKNPIIFGYGDDNSNEYKSIQAQGNNILLKNFKTFQYLKTTNYHRVLSMLSSIDNIKIEIIGHSCGLTDRALLKTIFEHSNVKKIEYRYHSEEENYFENLYNISRIFDSNLIMREKVLSLSETSIINPISIPI